jgi:hypothetical protein
MDFAHVFRTTHDFRKVTYNMLDKLHKIEDRSLANSPKIGNEYCVILFLQYLVELIERLYGQVDFTKKLIKALNVLIEKANENFKIYSTLLAFCLNRYTLIFNWLEEKKIRITVDNGDELANLWEKCISAYKAIWVTHWW